MPEIPFRTMPKSSFALLWAAESAGFFGVQVALFLLPITAAFTLSATPAQLGILGSAFFLPSLILGLIAGAWADRHDRRGMLLQAEVLSAACVLAVPIAALLNLLTVELLYLVSLLLGSATVHFNAAAFALLPGLVGRDRLVQANSQLQLSLATSRVAGPAVGGVLLPLITAPGAFALSAASFVICGLSLLRMPPVPQVQSTTLTSPPIWREIAAGLAFVVHRRAIGATAAYTGSSAGFAAASFAVLPLYAGELGIGPSALGLIVGATGVGGVVGSLIAAKMPRSLKPGPAIRLSALAIALAQWGMPLAGGLTELAFPLLAASRVVYGAATVVNGMQVISLQQRLTPDEVQGRMYATVRFVINCGATLGALGGGIVAQIFGLPETMAVAAIGATLAVLLLKTIATAPAQNGAAGADLR